MLINDEEAIKLDILKMSYLKQIQNNFSKILVAVNSETTIKTSARTSKYSPTHNKLDKLFDSELFFTDSIGAILLFTDGKNPLEVKKWK